MRNILILLLFPLQACSASEICMFGDRITKLEEGIEIVVMEDDLGSMVVMRMPERLNRDRFRYATISFLDKPGSGIDIDLNVRPYNRDLLVGSFSTGLEHLSFSVFVQYGSSCTGTIVEQGWQISPNE